MITVQCLHLSRAIHFRHIPKLPSQQLRRNSNRARSEVIFFVVRMVARFLGRGLSRHIRNLPAETSKSSPKQILVRKSSQGAFIRYLALSSPVILLGSYAFFYSRWEVVPLTNRHHLVWMTKQDEIELSGFAKQAVVNKEKNRILPEENQTVKQIRRIVEMFAEVLVELGHLDPGLASFDVNVIESSTANAFVLPNGSIFIYTGILPMAETEAGLASIIGHEISHALAHHSAEKLGVMRMLILIYEFMDGFFVEEKKSSGMNTFLKMILVTILQVLLSQAHSRCLETEADAIGLELTARAGYDPRYAPPVWVRMARSHGSSTIPEILSTHPSCSRRQDTLTALAVDLMPVYEKALTQMSVEGKVHPDSGKKIYYVPTKALKILQVDDQMNDTATMATECSAMLVGDDQTRLLEFYKKLQ